MAAAWRRETGMNQSIDRLDPDRRQLLGLFAGAAAALGAGALPARAEEEEVLTEALVLRDPDIPVAGNTVGDISIVEYFDYQCPYCRKVEPELRQVVHEDSKVRLIWKDWPILGPMSVTASRMALASRYQDKFIEAHDALIAINSKLTEAKLREALSSAGVDMARLDRDLSDKASAITATLTRNNDQALAFEFRGTPSFIVGKFRIPGVITMAQFGQAISDARKAAKVKK